MLLGRKLIYLGNDGKKPSRVRYWHFLLGYLLPIVDRHKGRSNKFYALSCGPIMDVHLNETFQRLGLDYKLVNGTTYKALSHFWSKVYVEPWDREIDPSNVLWAVDRIIGAWSKFNCRGSSCDVSGNLILNRSQSPAYYRDGSTKSHGYGIDRRSIDNLREISNCLTDRGLQHYLYEPGVHCIGCQIRAFNKAKKIFGIEGAEWANLVWTKDREVKIKILRVPKNRKKSDLQNFLDNMGFRYNFLAVDHAHVSIDPNQVLDFFAA